MNRIKKGDQVVVITGKDRGKRGDVLRVAGETVVVGNVNVQKRHTKPTPQANQPGGILEKEAPIHISNVMLFNPASGKGERIKYKTIPARSKEEKSKKIRVFRGSEAAVDA